VEQAGNPAKTEDRPNKQRGWVLLVIADCQVATGRQPRPHDCQLGAHYTSLSGSNPLSPQLCNTRIASMTHKVSPLSHREGGGGQFVYLHLQVQLNVAVTHPDCGACESTCETLTHPRVNHRRPRSVL